MRVSGGEPVSSAFLQVVVVGPSSSRGGAAADHGLALATTLGDAGHDVTLLSSHAPEGRQRSRRPWSSTPRRLRDADAILLVHTGAPSLARLLAVLGGLSALEHRVAAPDGSATVVLVAQEPPVLPASGAARRLTRALLRRCDAVLVHDEAAAVAVRALGAARVCVVPRPGDGSSPAGPAGPGATVDRACEATAAGPEAPVLTAEWARYVGAIEALAARWPTAGRDADGQPDPASGQGDRLLAARTVAVRVASSARLVRARRLPRRPVVALARLDLPEWVVPTDVLLDPDEAQDARRVASSLGLPRTDDATSAWAALGALAAVVRLVDDGRRSAVIVHESGAGAAGGAGGTVQVARGTQVPSDTSPFGRWARAAGFAPVALGLTDPEAPLVDLDLDLGSLDAIVRIHPHGCDRDDVDEAVGQASWALRQGGVLVVTLPLAAPGVPGGVTPADLRGIVARADSAGLSLVGDLDGELTARLSGAASAAASATAAPTAAGGDTAYGLARLVLRRA